MLRHKLHTDSYKVQEYSRSPRPLLISCLQKYDFCCYFSSLRIACLNFKELCNKKNNKGFWRDDEATVQASSHSGMSYMGTSGILLASKDNESSPELMINVQNGRLSSTRKPTESIDVFASESTTSHVTLDNNQGNIKLYVSII